MHQYQQNFIEFALQQEALLFGDFTLKSGRQSPYFFNAGLFNTGKNLQKLGQFYASAIENAQIKYNALFGPAYKGIPLVSSTAIALNEFDQNIPYAFNRKEIKDHGEGGQLVGANINGKDVLIVDDVITAGTAIREAMTFLKAAKAKPAGIVVALDRQECGQSSTSTIQEIEQQYHVPVISIIKMNDLIDYLSQQNCDEELSKMQAYRKRYGAI